MALERFDVDRDTDRLQAVLHQQRYEFILCRIRKDDRVLEIGTGVGAFTRALLPLCQSYVGVEFDAAACAEARVRTEGKANIVQADARNLPFADSEFSFVVCLEVLEHLGDWRAGIRETHRCLQELGTAVISVPYRRRGGPSKSNEHHLYEPGEAELVALLDQLFASVRVYYQYFEESTFMTLARRLHVRRFVGLAQPYGDLVEGKPDALNHLVLAEQPGGMKIGLIIVVAGKK